MRKLAWWVAALGLLHAGTAHAMTVGVATAINFEYTGGVRDHRESESAVTELPNTGFAIPDIGSGALSAMGQATHLTLAASAAFTAAASSLCECIGVGGHARGYAVSQDVFTPSGGTAGQAGTLRIVLRVSGTNAASSDNGVASGLSARAVLNVSTLPAAIAGPLVTTTAPGPLLQQLFTSNVVSGAPASFDLPIVFGTSQLLWLELIAIAEGAVTTGSFAATSDFSQTVEFQSLQLLDAQGVPVANPSLDALSGTEYPLSGVPEPSSALLAVVGIIGLGCAKRLRR